MDIVLCHFVSCSLKVLIPPTLNPQQNRTVDEGQLFSMDCIITRSDESFELTWRRDGLDREDFETVVACTD